MTSTAPHIVNDRQRGQKYPCTGWRARRDQCQCAEGKGNIGRNGNTPTPGSKSDRVENPVERSRNNHAADGARDGKRCFAHGGQLTDDQLPFDLQTNQQEKHCHQSVVDPLMQRQ
jgi:hypothetical protein